MTRTFLTPALLGALLLGVATAQGMDHSQHAMPSATAAVPMDMSGLQKLTGQAFDRAFLSLMIPHHQMAVEMARAVLPRTKDATVKTWANAVIKTQAAEINQMNTLLKGLGGSDVKRAALMRASMKGMADAVHTAKHPDAAFVRGMLPHHASAIDMANLALQRSRNAGVLQLARDITRAQAGEMYDFQLWLLKR